MSIDHWTVHAEAIVNVVMFKHLCLTGVKSVHVDHVHSQLFAPMNTRVHGKILPLSLVTMQ